jgi:peptidoglycan/LPS O-acetylase OafA/YrhL
MITPSIVGPSTTDGRLAYIPELDALRAFAVLTVMAWHFSGETTVLALPTMTAVRLFFCLSGYLITALLLQDLAQIEAGVLTRREAIRGFYVRRALRIFPIYYLMLAVVGIGGHDGVAADLAWHATYTSNVMMAMRGEWSGGLPHLWSLAVEAQFYLLAPWLVLVLSRRHLKVFLWACLALGPLWRWLALARGQEVAAVVMLPGAADALCAGALLAVARDAGDGVRARSSLNAGIALAAVAAVLWLAGAPAGTAAIAPLAVTAILVWTLAYAVGRPTPAVSNLLRLGPARYTGQISYGLYLYHPVVRLLIAPLALHGVTGAAAAIGATYLVASLSRVVVERPFLRLQTRFDASRPGRSATAGALQPVSWFA